MKILWPHTDIYGVEKRNIWIAFKSWGWEERVDYNETLKDFWGVDINIPSIYPICGSESIYEYIYMSKLIELHIWKFKFYNM